MDAAQAKVFYSLGESSTSILPETGYSLARLATTVLYHIFTPILDEINACRRQCASSPSEKNVLAPVSP